MTAPQFHSRYRTIPASLMLSTLGASLTAIKSEDGATDSDLGAVLGKSDDRAAAYRNGDADMGLVSFLRGVREWDGRFANAVLGLVGMKVIPIEAGEGADRETLTAMATLLAQVAAALEDDGEIDDEELGGMSQALEAAGKHIDRLRDRRRLKIVSN